jgi:hypothetical protein
VSDQPQQVQEVNWERLQPKDDEDRNRRALFYCHCIHAYSKRTLDLLLTRADSGEFGEALQEQIPLLNDWQLESAYKILTCISLHMAGLDHGGNEAPTWLIYFFSEAAQETDELFPEPPAIEIIGKHGSWKREKMVSDVAKHASQLLGLTEGAEQFQSTLAQVLVQSTTYRAELLLFGLSQPPEALRRHLEMLGG